MKTVDEVSDSFADVQLIRFMVSIGFELNHNEGIADWFVKDEGTSELTVFGAREMRQVLYQLILDGVIGEDYMFDRPQDEYLPNVYQFLKGKNELREHQRLALAKLFGITEEGQD